MRRPFHSLLDVLKTFPLKGKRISVESNSRAQKLKGEFHGESDSKCALHSGDANTAEEGGADGGS